ncbi:MAG: glycosyl transferase family 28 [Alphaproteobacteria bacterium]|nr:glycosyl transferase family 28 [Alphaproteobacteria bacterium]
MIFATVGTQLPFDRLIESLDKWQSFQRSSQVFAQVGPKGKVPSHIEWMATLTPQQFAKNIAKCKIVVSHAGMGTILTALGAGKPIILMPRLARYGEHRNDHQLATVANLRNRRGIYVAMDEASLFQKLDSLHALEGGEGLQNVASPELLCAITDFIETKPREVRHA